MPILPLPASVCEQIKSSIQIATLNDVAEELLKNSVDANSASVEIEVDFAKGFCAVQDNGVGIPPAEFAEDGSLARPDCTSKLNTPQAYGRRGCFLSYLSSLSLMSIESRHEGSECASSAFLGHSTVLSRQVCTNDAQLMSHGTRVAVHNLFGNLPVRFKRLALRYANPAEEEKAFDELKKRLVGYLLASPKRLNLRLRNRNSKLRYVHRSSAVSPSTAETVFDLEKIVNVLRCAGLTELGHITGWKLASAKAGEVAIRAAICLAPSPSKQCQFIAIGHLPILSSGTASLLYNTINAVFDSSQFGALPEETTTVSWPATRTALEHNQSSLQSRMVKGVDKWPRFFVRIDTKAATVLDDIPCEDAVDEGGPPAIQAVLDLLKTLFVQFLTAQNLSPRGHRAQQGSITRITGSARHQFGSKSSSVYGNWKRSKHSCAFPADDAHSGLPFTSQNGPSLSDLALGEDVRLLLGDMDLDPEVSRTRNGTDDEISIHFSPHSDTEQMRHDEEVLSWTDPRTGQHLQVDLDNGFVLSHTPHCNPNMTSIVVSERVPPRTCVRRLPQVLLARSDLADRLKHWPSAAFGSAAEQKIRSVVLNDYAAPTKCNLLVTGVAEQKLQARQLANARVLGQVDDKFILAVLPTCDSPALIVVDQHAADERIKVEELYRQLCSHEAVQLTKPVKFEVSTEERKQFVRHRDGLTVWAIEYDLNSIGDSSQEARATSTVTVYRLPSIIAERCCIEPKFLIELLRKEVWSSADERRLIPATRDDSWISKLSYCPEGLIEMVNSRACRTAIMFNDVLTNKQCTGLLRQLSKCALPFQCAHGRPCVSVIASLGGSGIGFDYFGKGEGDFGYAYQKWCGIDSGSVPSEWK